MSERLFTEIIRQACRRHGVELRERSAGWLLELHKGGMMRRVIATDFDVNDHVAVSIAKDKAAMSELLAENNVPHVPHTLVRSRADQAPNTAVIHSLLTASDVVIKPLRGERGHNVQRVRTVEQAVSAIEASNETAWAVCPYIDAEYEIRVVVIYGEVLLTHKKTSRVVRNGLRLFNLSLGATPEPIGLADLPDNIRQMSLSAVKVSGLNVAAVDILVGPDAVASVLEVNGSFSLTYYAASGDAAYDAVATVYDRLVQKLFE